MESLNNILFIGSEKRNLPDVQTILDNLPCDFNFPVFICIPYIRAYKLDFIKFLSSNNNHIIRYPKDNEIVEDGVVYLASPLVHTFIGRNKTFYISREYTKYYTQPSIDLSLISFIDQYQGRIKAIIFPNSSKDGIFGLKKLKALNGEILICKDKELKLNCDCNCYNEIVGGEYCFDIKEIISKISKINQYA